MSTSSDTTSAPGAPPPWLLPAIVAALVAGAALLAVLITGAPAPAAQAPTAQAPAAQSSTGVADSMGEGHGGLDPAGPAVAVINLAEARAAFDAGNALFVDVRAGSAYAAGHIPGAVSIASAELERRLREAPAGTTIIAYGDAERPESGQRGAQIFMELGYPPMVALEGGFQRWEAAGHPVERAP